MVIMGWMIFALHGKVKDQLFNIPLPYDMLDLYDTKPIQEDLTSPHNPCQTDLIISSMHRPASRR